MNIYTVHLSKLRSVNILRKHVILTCINNVETLADSTKLFDMNIQLPLTLLDERTSKWFLMSTPWPVLCLLCIYILIVLVGGRLMKRTNAFNVKNILIFYNTLLVLFSIYMLYEVCLSIFAQLLDIF